jgi:hypothetical protein
MKESDSEVLKIEESESESELFYTDSTALVTIFSRKLSFQIFVMK